MFPPEISRPEDRLAFQKPEIDADQPDKKIR
jgi:hypothetical protein